MSDTRFDCDRFDHWLLKGSTPLDGDGWRAHLAACATCREQWQAHQLLAATFAHEAVPELSPAFDCTLNRLCVPEARPRPLAGWRQVAMFAYVAAAGGLLVWALEGVPLPRIDLSTPWVPLVTLVAIPLSFVLAVGVSRWLPERSLTRRPRLFAL